MSKQPTSEAFREAIKDALEHFNDPFWLGEYSPLAMPYLLSKTLDIANVSPQARGRSLQDLLRTSASRIPDDPKTASRFRKIIQHHYFDGQSAVKVQRILTISNDTFYKSLIVARDRLAATLIEELQPALSLESPPKINLELFERNFEIAECLQALRDRRTVSIDGMGGSGKTTIAGVIAEKWGRSSVFWYTIRPSYNDYLATLLFHLGYFLRKQGSPNLWLELTASPGKVNISVVSGLLRHAFTAEIQAPLLICIDDVDLLVSAENGEHAQIIHLLAELRSHTSILLLGQQIRLESDHLVNLKNLSLAVTTQYLQQHQIFLSSEQISRLHFFSNGNPRLLVLFSTLHQVGGSIPEVLNQMTETPSLEFLLGGIFQRLSEVECGLMMELAVVQDGAPTHFWTEQTLMQAIFMLSERQLLQSDNREKVWLLPAFAETMIKLIPEAKLADLHERAAQRFAVLGQFTTSTYHYVQAKQTDKAIALWDEHQKDEINQGQVFRALHIFRQALAQPLHPVEREKVTVFCAHMERIIGNLPRAQEDLRSILFKTPLLAVEADALMGEIANEQPQWEEAERMFRRGITNASQIVELQLVRLHKGLGWRFKGERQLDLALRQAQFAQYELENFKGFLEEDCCNYPQSEIYYQTALALAEYLDHTEGIAKTCNNLSGLYARLGRFSESLQFLAKSDGCYRKMGKRLALAENKLTYGFGCNLAGDHGSALAAAGEAIATLQDWNIQPNPLFQTYINQMIAEAHLGLGNLVEAERYVQSVIEAEETSLLPDAYRTYAEVLTQKGEPDRAVQYLTHSIDLAQTFQDTYLEAYAWRAKGQVLVALQDQEAAQGAFVRAIELFQERKLSWEARKTIQLCPFPLLTTPLKHQ